MKIAEGKISINQQRFNAQLVNNGITYLKKAAASAEAGREPIIRALSAAMDIEKGMIERHFFEAAAGDDEDVKKVLDALQQGTKMHIEKIRIAWEENRENI